MFDQRSKCASSTVCRVIRIYKVPFSTVGETVKHIKEYKAFMNDSLLLRICRRRNFPVIDFALNDMIWDEIKE